MRLFQNVGVYFRATILVACALAILCSQAAVYAQTGRIDDEPDLAVEMGHRGIIETATFSPDGRFALTGSNDRTTVLWNVSTGREVRRFEGCPFAVQDVAISRDSRYVAAACSDARGPVIIWEFSTGRKVMELPVPYPAVAFAPDSHYLLTAGGSLGYYSVQLWDLRNWQSMSFPNHLSQLVRAVDFSPNGEKFLVASQDHVLIFDMLTNKQELDIPVSDGLTDALFSPSGGYILITSNRTAQLWDVDTGKKIRRFAGHFRTVRAAAFSPDASQIATASSDGTGALWDVKSGQLLHVFKGHASEVSAVAFSPTGEYVLTGGWDAVAILWDARTGDKIRRLEGNASPVQDIDLSEDGRLLVTANTDNGASVWDLEAGRRRQKLKMSNERVLSVAFDPRAKFVATASNNSAVRLWTLDSGRMVHPFIGHSGPVNSVAFSPNGEYVTTASEDRTVRVWDTNSAQEKMSLEHKPWPALFGVRSAKFSRNGHDLLTVIGHGKAAIWNIDSEQMKTHFAEDSKRDFEEGSIGSRALELMSAAYSPDERFVVAGAWDGTIRLWNAETGKRIGAIIKGHYPWSVNAVSFAIRNSLLITASFDGTAGLWNLNTGLEIRRFSGHSSGVNSARASSDEKFLFTSGDDGTVRIWNFETGSELAKLMDFKDDTWAIVTPDGRFDTNSLEGIKGLHWAMHDDPLSSLPVEIFMREYYEPRLLSRLLSCTRAEQLDPDACKQQFTPVRQLSKLNRIQPEVKTLKVRRGVSADEALVDVGVAGKADPTQKNGKMQTAAYDLRLFRDGQLVGQWPEPRSGAAAARDDLSLWRQSALVPGTDGAGKVTHTFAVHLAHRDRGQPVTLTAYAFNEDRVKSETAPASYTAPSDMSQRIPRAYVVTIGINGYQNPKRNLEFAVNDAEDMAAALQHIAGHEVVPVSLVSEAPGAAKPVNEATKDKIRAVLMLLAGEPVDQTILGGIANADRLAKATPDDLVILTFSGHGYTEQDGAFYLLPSDSGTEDRITKASVPKFISSEELSEWLRKLDAGEMAMVIDACHSAASVEAGGFKPGPMGDRGLGQLAYDKGMRILAASQADDVALEVRNLHHGLLTYALVDEGLQPGSDGRLRADLKHDGAVTLGEWLKYGEERTPSLYEDARAGRVRLISRDSTVNAAFIDATATHAQTPALFDFNKANDNVVVSKQ